MKLRFEPDLPHQRAAIDAVLAAVDSSRLEGGGLAPSLPGVVAFANPTGAPPRLAVEMETGTGKTYVFLRTALELAARDGIRKILVVVPSIAIREGVVATLRATREHFAGLFPSLAVRFFGYRRERLARLRRFVAATTVEIMVLTADAFTKDTNVLRRPHDAFGGASPLQALAATRPLVITDEPHRFQTALRRGALAQLSPCMTLAYGATLGREPGRVVHRLTGAQAHRRGLVKSIVVHGSGGDDGYGQQIRDTVAAHLRRARQLRIRGIKVLSLFFLDRVGAYADQDGRARAHFDRHFDELKRGDPHFEHLPAAAVRSAYFASRGGRCVDSKTGSSAADRDAYALILADKERLLSLEEPVSFVFSHSALREGWDNPNVTQICTLGRSDSAVRKRQEIGRGVRLVVDQDGRRVSDPGVNVLEVFANDSYEAFVAGLQGEGRDPDEQAPLPARSTPAHPARPSVSSRWPNDDELVRRLAEALRAFAPVPSAGSRSVIDVAMERLARELRPVRRATVLEAIIASGNANALASDPLRGGLAVADAVRRATQG